jgi:hypothetical protein
MFADDEPGFQSHQKDQKGAITRAGASWRLVVRQPPLPLRDDLRAKPAAAVPGHRDPHPDPPQYHGLGAVAMAGVPPAVARRVALHAPEMIVEPLPRRTGPERGSASMFLRTRGFDSGPRQQHAITCCPGAGSHGDTSLRLPNLAPPAGFEPALTAPEAAVASWRILLLTSRDAAGTSVHSEDRSAHVPDHGPSCMAGNPERQRELTAGSWRCVHDGGVRRSAG